jgi:adenylate cyclase
MAVAMQKRMRELQSEWRALGVQNLFRLRIGINTGFCTVGNFGSEDRMDYTIIGSEVNLASRLQAHAELGGILLGHETHALVREAIATSEQDPITVKGFAKPVRIYKVLGLRDEFAGADGQIRYEGQSGNLTIDFDDLSQAEGRKLRQLAEQIIGRLNASEAPG